MILTAFWKEFSSEQMDLTVCRTVRTAKDKRKQQSEQKSWKERKADLRSTFFAKKGTFHMKKDCGLAAEKKENIRSRNLFNKWFALLLSIGLALTSVSLPDPVQAEEPLEAMVEDTAINPNFTIQHFLNFPAINLIKTDENDPYGNSSTYLPVYNTHARQDNGHDGLPYNGMTDSNIMA